MLNIAHFRAFPVLLWTCVFICFGFKSHLWVFFVSLWLAYDVCGRGGVAVPGDVRGDVVQSFLSPSWAGVVSLRCQHLCPLCHLVSPATSCSIGGSWTEVVSVDRITSACSAGVGAVVKACALLLKDGAGSASSVVTRDPAWRVRWREWRTPHVHNTWKKMLISVT